MNMQRFATLLMAMIASAGGNSLRGGTTEGNDRVLYGRENGLKGFKAIVADLGKEANDEAMPVTDIGRDPNFVGPQVLIEPQPLQLGREEGGLDTRIVGGSPSDPVPSFAMHLRYQSYDRSWHNAGCGGSLVSNCHIVTAAHCVVNGRAGLPQGVYVNAYEPFNGNNGQPFHFSAVREVTAHSGFDDNSNINDIAVITMETCANTNTFPIMDVADSNFLSGMSNGDTTTVVGFGDTYAGDTTFLDHLRTVDVPFISNGKCDEYYPGKIEDDMICAGKEEGGVDACQGDSGGPLFVSTGNGANKKRTLVGVVSWGAGCALAGRPGVYSSTAYHHEYIKGIVCSDSRTDTDIPLCAGSAPQQGNRPVPATAAPSAAPTVFPSEAPSRMCAELNEGCYSTLDCCDQMICMLRDQKCVLPSTATYSKNSSGNRVSIYGNRREGN